MLTGEIRSYDHGKALETVRMTERIFTEEAQKINATAEVTSQIHLIAYETPLESKSVTDFQKACEILGFSGELTGTFGGSDNNSFAKTESKGLFYRMECIMHIRHVSTQPPTIFIKERS